LTVRDAGERLCRLLRGDAMSLNPDAEDAYFVQDYVPRPVIEGVEVLDRRWFHDDGAALTELGRFDDGLHQDLAGFAIRQLNYSLIEPGTIKAFHLHRHQTDVWYVPPHDRVLVVLGDVRAGSPTSGRTMRIVLGGGSNRLLRIPPEVAHGARNVGTETARILYFTDRHFSPEPDATDEGRLPWDFFGEAIWEIERG
jgi:dTDP-4-dehydrorhamnose 3,5-epimerase